MFTVYSAIYKSYYYYSASAFRSSLRKKKGVVEKKWARPSSTERGGVTTLPLRGLKSPLWTQGRTGMTAIKCYADMTEEKDLIAFVPVLLFSLGTQLAVTRIMR